MKSRRLSLPLIGAVSLVLAAPAMAQTMPPPPGVADPRPEWHGGPAATPQPQQPGVPGYDQAAYQQARANWLAECRRRQAGNGKMVGGAVLGGLVGGVVGNRVAGEGNRTEGTVIGAAAGAMVGGAVGASADRREARDYCEAYLDQYTAQQPVYGHGYSYGYAPMMVMVPVVMVPVAGQAAQQRECVETVVTEEWVTVTEKKKKKVHYVAPRPDKRVRVVPDKRQRI